ncbi:MAG: TonB-dependent receptor plug domain-containing protein [Bacteroidota bacterium]
MHRVIHIAIQSGLGLLLCLRASAYPITDKEVNGIVVDASLGWPIHSVSISVNNSIATLSDSLGQFILSVDKYPAIFIVGHEGYHSFRVLLEEHTTAGLRIELVPKEYHADEIVIIATRQPVSTIKSPSSVTFIPQTAIENSIGGSVGSILAGVPSLFLRDYGGRNGIQSLSIRGTYSEHTLVLIDGMRYNSFQNSQTDFGLLSTSNVQHIEIVKGGHSSVYGADAIGGVINIVTRKPEGKNAIRAKASLGSSGYQAQEVSAGGQGAGIGWRGMARRERGNGRYKFRFDDGITSSVLRREGADYDLIFLNTFLEYRFLPELSATGGFDYSDADRGSPGAVTSTGLEGRARLTDRISRSHVGLVWNPSSVVDARLHSSFIATKQTYTDLESGVGLFSEHENNTLLINPEIQYSYSDEGSATVGGEVSRAEIISTDVIHSIRRQISAYLSLHHGIFLNAKIPQEIIFYPSVRYDYFSSLQGDVNPKLGMNIGLFRSPQIRIRSSYGKNFRVPSFNELYWKVGGNPDLRAERSYSFDFGVVVAADIQGPFTLDVGAFNIKTTDRIVWSPGAGGIWSPRNILSVESQGLEAEARWTGFDGILGLSTNFTLNDVRKRSEDYPGDPTRGKIIPYIPEQTVGASLTVTAEPVTFHIRHAWTSFRYTTEINDRSLPGHSVTDAMVRFSIPTDILKTEVKLEATNVFNSSYTIIPLYPTPLREFKLTLGVEL